jgi:AraC-like DNA-binding protein
MKYTFYLGLALSLWILLPGCEKPVDEAALSRKSWKSESTSSPVIAGQIERNKELIRKFYSTNPDSAIFFYLKIIDLYSKHQMPYNVFDAYIKISELYCFRKNDGVNAVFYYGEALKTMNKYGGYEDSDPFFYIDMGNMFYMNKIYPQAHKSFEKAISIATLKNDKFAISIALNNLGIVFREERDFDSSKSCFRKSLSIRSGITPLYEAQNYLYLAKVFTYQDMADSILFYRNLAVEALRRHSGTKVDPSIITETAAKALADGFHIYELELMAIVSKLKNDPARALEYYRLASDCSNAAGDQESVMIYLYNMAEVQNMLGKKKEALELASLAFQLALSYRNHEYVVSTSKLLNQLYTEVNSLNQANFYLNKVVDYGDSLNRKETSAKLKTARLLLITNEVEESVRQYQFQVKKHQKVLKIQSLSIAALTIFLLLACVVIYLIYRRRVAQKQEYLRQIAAIVQNLEMADKLAKQRKNDEVLDFYSEVEVKLCNLMEVEKFYLQKNITLSELADKLGTNATYLSQYINNQLKTNFNDYLNSQRIDEACRLFRRNTSLKYSVDQIADMVGFSSRTTFYTTFKKFTGITPAVFQKYILSSDLQ